MAIASLFNIPSTEDELSAWSFAHMAHHRDVNRAILMQAGVVVPEYILDPFDPDNAATWLQQHQSMHNVTDEIYGISGYDLTEVNWADQSMRAGWIYLNAQLHVSEANATGMF